MTAESHNGMVRIEAVSLTGTGFNNHGPYHYQFRWSDKVGGRFVEQSRFDVRYDSRDHFGLSLYISPAGNGVLVQTSFSPEIVFRDRMGRVLRTWKRTELKLERGGADDGHFLGLLDPIPVPVPGYPNAANYCRKGELFLPAAEPVSEALERRLLECIVPPRADADVAARIADLGHGDAAIRDRAAAELKQKSAVDALERAAAGDSAAAGRAKEILGAILVEQFGCARPWRDVGFLGALLLYPSAKVAGAATARLEAVLGKEALEQVPKENLERIARWLQTHVDQLEWQVAEGRYGWKPGGR